MKLNIIRNRSEWDMLTKKNQNFYNPAIPEVIDLPEVPIGAMLKGSAKKYQNKVALIYNDYNITFKELYEESLKFANALQSLGYGKGDIISVYLPNSIQYVISYFGILLSGATYSPVNPFLPPREVVYQLKDNHTKAIITHKSFARNLVDHANDLNLQTVIVTGQEELLSFDHTINPKQFAPDWYSFNALKRQFAPLELNVDIDPKNDIAHISYTGGTTGPPRGVLSSHFNFVSNCVLSSACMGFLPNVDETGALTTVAYTTNDDEFLKEYPNLPGTAIMMSPAPLYHISVLMGSVGIGILQGNTVILIDQFAPDVYIANIEKYKVTMISGAPPMFNYLLSLPAIRTTDCSSINTIASGAAPLSSETQRLLQELFPNARITEGYSLTEATGTCIQNVAFKSGIRKLGTVGLPMYNTEVKLVPVDGTSEYPVPKGDAGELWIKGPQVSLGYLNNPQATKETFTNGWLRTGDVAIQDKDGLISIVNSKKDILIYNGYNIYPRQLEELLYEHEAVHTAIVIGVVDPKVGEKPKAFIVLQPGATAALDDIQHYVNSRVLHYSKIQEIVAIDALPMTASGKISKIALQKLESQKTQ